MNITISGSITVKDRSGQTHTIQANDIAFDEVSVIMQAQGPCRTYEGVCEEDNWFVAISVEEYPEGSPNGHMIETSNCQLIGDGINCGNGDVGM